MERIRHFESLEEYADIEGFDLEEVRSWFGDDAKEVWTAEYVETDVEKFPSWVEEGTKALVTSESGLVGIKRQDGRIELVGMGSGRNERTVSEQQLFECLLDKFYWVPTC